MARAYKRREERERTYVIADVEEVRDERGARLLVLCGNKQAGEAHELQVRTRHRVHLQEPVKQVHCEEQSLL